MPDRKRGKHAGITFAGILGFAVSVLLVLPMPAIADDALFLFTGPTVGLEVASPVDGERSVDFYGGGELLIGRRGAWSGEGNFSFVSRFQGLLYSDLKFRDQEYLNLKAGFPESTFEIALLASLIDDGSGSTYFNPDIKISRKIALLSNGGAVSVDYTGYLVLLPGGAGDFFHQGASALYRADPSISFGYEMSAGGSWEYFYEQPVYLKTGETTGNRHDFVLDITGTLDGFAGYFTEWAVTSSVSWRVSNATLMNGADFFDHFQDRLRTAIGGMVFTSPHQSWTIEGELSAEGVRYLSRPARDVDGIYGDEKLALLEIAGTGRLEWSPDQETYLSLDAGFGYTVSNDPFVGGWSARCALQLTL